MTIGILNILEYHLSSFFNYTVMSIEKNRTWEDEIAR